MSDLTKGELVEMLGTAKSSAQKNRIIKLLKKFDPNPKEHLDKEGDISNIKLKQSDQLMYFMCFRCDSAKIARGKYLWKTSEGIKTLCNACFSHFNSESELKQAQKEYGLLKKFK